jgi:hypothetical protein
MTGSVNVNDNRDDRHDRRHEVFAEFDRSDFRNPDAARCAPYLRTSEVLSLVTHEGTAMIMVSQGKTMRA